MIKPYCKKCSKELSPRSHSIHCRSCNNFITAQKRRKQPPTCIDCGKQVARRDNKRCRSCNTENMRLHPPNPNPGSMEKSPGWRGGRTLDKRGYVYIKSPNHPFCNAKGYVFEHRLIMENYLGRYLSKVEVIHHLNGRKQDNRIENLRLYINHKEHVRNHHTHQLKPRPRNPINGR